MFTDSVKYHNYDHAFKPVMLIFIILIIIMLNVYILTKRMLIVFILIVIGIMLSVFKMFVTLVSVKMLVI